jgi:hypothetical protein
MTSDQFAAADACFQSFDFGSAIIEDADGWEHDGRDPYLFRTIYLQHPTDPARDSVRGYFAVTFASPTSHSITGVDWDIA